MSRRRRRAPQPIILPAERIPGVCGLPRGLCGVCDQYEEDVVAGRIRPAKAREVRVEELRPEAPEVAGRDGA
jgi:hypothetical protein